MVLTCMMALAQSLIKLRILEEIRIHSSGNVLEVWEQ